MTLTGLSEYNDLDWWWQTTEESLRQRTSCFFVSENQVFSTWKVAVDNIVHQCLQSLIAKLMLIPCQPSLPVSIFSLYVNTLHDLETTPKAGFLIKKTSNLIYNNIWVSADLKTDSRRNKLSAVVFLQPVAYWFSSRRWAPEKTSHKKLADNSLSAQK